MRRLLLSAVIAATALVSVGAFTPAQADSTCSADGPIGVAAYEDGVQICVAAGTVDAAVTATPSYVVADGEDANPEPLDGYIGVDESGPVGCSSGEYEPGGENNPIVDPADPAPSGDCQPQAPR